MAIEMLSDGGTIDLRLEIGGQAFRLLRCDVDEGLSTCGVVSALVQTFEDVDFEPLLEEDATISITIDGLEVRRFSRRLGRATFSGLDDAALRYVLDLYPTFWFSQLDKNTRKFRDKTTEDIVSAVLGASGVTFSWRTLVHPSTARERTAFSNLTASSERKVSASASTELERD